MCVSQRTKTLLLTMHIDDRFMIEALHAGIRGDFVKTQMAADLVGLSPRSIGCA
jgi:DNA-binding NarL/FixJ family response regulator